VYFRSECPRGETGIYLVSDGSVNPFRLKIRTGSFVAMNIFEKVTRGLMIADIVAVIGSFDIILPRSIDSGSAGEIPRERRPASGGRPPVAVTLLLMVVVAVVILVFALTFEGVGSLGAAARWPATSRPGSARTASAQRDPPVPGRRVKLVLKEDIIPANADRLLFQLAPYFVSSAPSPPSWSSPFGVGLIAADLNIGIYYVMAVTSLVWSASCSRGGPPTTSGRSSAACGPRRRSSPTRSRWGWPSSPRC